MLLLKIYLEYLFAIYIIKIEFELLSKISSSAQPAQTLFCLRFVLGNIYKIQAIIFCLLILVYTPLSRIYR